MQILVKGWNSKADEGDFEHNHITNLSKIGKNPKLSHNL